MSGTLNISNLSYKELQALALRYRVPGNIKKQLLIEVLQAARCGNEQEVDKLLTDLRQTRKKRMRKGKPTKLAMSLASTPIHSPNYDMADDYYAHQHRLPYQWVGAEEEIPNRQDESSRVPQYEEFRQFLLRRIQRDYQTYNTNHNDRVDAVDPGVIMDLRNDHQADSIRFETNTQAEVRSNNIIPLNSLDTAQTYSEQMTRNTAAFDYQILEDSNGNGNASILLRRMLQAPVGADLGEIASPELGSSCRIWGAEYNQNENNNILDNSDTLSANSDVNGNDDNNWPIGTEYYRFVSNVRDQLILNPENVPNRTFHDQSTNGQFSTVLTDDNPVQYQLLYTNPITDMQPQPDQPKWEAGPFDNDILNYQKLKTQGSKIFPGGSTAYYDEISATNYGTTRPVEVDPLQQQYANENRSAVGYSANQNGFEGNNSSTSAPSRSEIKFYQNLNNGSIPELDPENSIQDVYSTLQHPARQINATNNFTLAKPTTHSTVFYGSGEAMQQASGFIPQMQNMQFSSQYQVPPPAHNGYLENLGCSSNPVQLTTQIPQIEEFNRQSAFGQCNTIQKANPLFGNQPIVQTEDRGDAMRRPLLLEGENDILNKTILGSTSTTQSDSTTSLEPFWPQRTGGQNTTDNSLENILNLNTHGYVDYSKIDQTSCIYCYSAPIVTQRLFTAAASYSQKKRFIAEFRQHTFSPYWLLYNDNHTGMQMSKRVKSADKVQESVEDEKMETTVSGVTGIPLDLENSENINGPEFPPDKEQLNSGVTELIPITTDRSYGKEKFLRVPSVDSNVQMDMKFGTSINTDSKGQEESQSPIDLNIEHTEQKYEPRNENDDTSVIESSETPSNNVY